MIANKQRIGERVKVKSNGRNAIIVGRTEPFTNKADLVRIKYDNSTKFEYILTNAIESLPSNEQFPAFRQ